MEKSTWVIIVLLMVFVFPIALGQTNQGQLDYSNSFVWALVLNVFGGVLAAVVCVLFNKLWRYLRQWQLRQFFGADFNKEGNYNLVYGSFALSEVFDENRKPVTHPYHKSGRDYLEERHCISIDNPISGGDFRAIRYIASVFGRGGQIFPPLVNDNEIDEKMDISLVAVGGPNSNYKTKDILSFPGNHLITMTDNEIQTPKFSFKMNDYGVILRLSPKQFPGRVWIVCAGLGEWGTSGAAWYLANRWKNLVRENRRWYDVWKDVPEFAAVIKVHPKKDELATPIAYFLEKRGNP